MSTPVIAFFNNKEGVGKTTLIYHLSWMYVELGLRVVVADLDPQANLTAAFLDDDRLEELWARGRHPQTIFGCIQPLMEGTSDITEPHLEYVELGAQPSLWGSPIALLVGDLLLSSFEDDLSEAWQKCLASNQHSFRVMSAFWRIIQRAASEHKADVVLIDIGPNLGAINRAALIAADFVVVPLATDLFSLQGLRCLGPTLRRWRDDWKDRIIRNVTSDILLPQGEIQPLGYIIFQHAIRMDRPFKAYDRWLARIPEDYREYVLEEPVNANIGSSPDPYRLTLLRHYPSLMLLAREAHKPMFSLKPADRAVGAHTKAVQDVYKDFKSLALEIAKRTNLPIANPFNPLASDIGEPTV